MNKPKLSLLLPKSSPDATVHLRNRPGFLVFPLAVTLAFGMSAKAAVFNWDPAINLSNSGGPGNWNLTLGNWNNGAADGAWGNTSADQAIFGGTGGVVLMNQGATITANSLVFNTGGYTINANAAADTLTLAGTTPTISVTNSGDAARINSILTGTAGLTVGGSGMLVLGGTNTLTGQIIIGSGATLGLTSAGGLGSNAAGSETIVQSGGTLNIGGQGINNNPAPATPGEEIRIAGSGVGGIGAIVNNIGTANNTLAKIVLTADATINAGGSSPTSYGSAGNIVTSNGGRIDIRTSGTPTAGQKHLDLAGFTLTKTGGHLLSIVNADVSNGNIVVNEGQLNFEGASLLQGTGTVTVNSGGKLGFWSIANAANITRPIVVNGGTFGDPTGSGANQTINSTVTITGAKNPNFVAQASTTTLAGLISEDGGSTITELSKRGTATLAFSNQANSFDAPITIYAGNLQGNFTTVATGGVAPAAPTALAGTPLGTASNVTLAGGSLNIRVDGANDATNQVFSIGKTVTLDRAPGGINLDRLTATGGTDKNIALAVTFAPASASNGWSIGQNQFTGAQTNGFRTQFTSLTMNNDTVLNVGDFTFTGSVSSANKNSLVHIGGNSWGFVGGSTQDFNALFQLGSSNLRIGSMYGTGVTSNTVTAGTGPIYNAPNNGITIRTATNIAPGQTIDMVSQKGTQSTVNLEQFTSVPTALRATGGGVLGIGGSTFATLDLSKLGDGTFRVGANFIASGNGTISGLVTPGAGNVARFGGGGTVTLSGTNGLTGVTALEVGSDLINGGFRTSITGTAQNGTVLLSGANNYTGGTTVNRSSVLRFQNLSLGNGAVNNFGTLTAEGAAGTFINGGVQLPVNLYGGSTLRFDSSALTTATDTDRWQDSAAINLNAGTLQLDARNNNSTTNETVGTISYAGGSAISLQRNNVGAAQIVQLQTPSLTRVGAGTLEIARGANSGFGTNVKLLATGTAPTVANGMISPSIMVIDATRLTNFATYDANGINNAAYTATIGAGSPAGTFNTGLSATGIYYADFAAANTTLTLADNPIVYALKVGGGTGTTALATSGANNTITLRSGGLIFSGDLTSGNFSTDGTRTINVAPNLVANDGAANIEAVINTRSAYTANLNGTVTANGLTKAGAGTLILNANNGATLSGLVSINQGILQSYGPTTTSTYNTLGTGLIQLNGGQLNLRSNNTAVTGTINQTLQNGLSVAANIPIATLDVNRSGADTASSGSFIFNPATVGSTGLQLLGSAGVQGQTLNVNGANYSVQFGDNAVNSFAGNVTINNAVNLTLNNNPSISGTNPVITKSGAGVLEIGATGGTSTVATGTQMVVNGGTLQLRSTTALGTAAQTSLVMNGGALNLRREGTSIFGSTAGYPVQINGNSTISSDRVSSTTNGIHTLGKLTWKNDATLSTNTGNGYALDFTGVDLQGTGFMNVTGTTVNTVDSGVRLQGAVTGGTLVKQGGGFMHLMGAANTYDGGTFVQAGVLRARAAGALGTGTVTVNPGGTIDFNSNSNLNANQPLVIRSNSSILSMVSVNANGVTHPVGANVDSSGASTGIIGISNGNTDYNNVINLSSLYGGRWSLGGVSNSAYDPRYTAASLGAGADNLYRLGGGGTSFFLGIQTAAGGVARNNVLTGNNSVRLGFDSGNILPFNGTNYQYVLGGTNDYTGDTIIHRGMVARAGTVANVSGQSAFSTGAVDVFGTLMLASGATLQNGGVATNALTLHPGSHLQLDNNAGPTTGMGTVNATNRISDTQAISLNGSLIELIGNTNNVSSESLGAVTYDRGARLRVARAGTGTATLTLDSLTPADTKGNSFLIQTAAAGTLGAASNGDRILITNSAPTPVNGMVSSAFVNATDNTFVTYGATNGFANITYDNTVTGGTYNMGTLNYNSVLGTGGKLDVNTTALTLNDNPIIYALRTNQSINLGGPFSTMTIRSGGLIAQTNTVTIAPNLVFNDGSSNIEAHIYAASAINITGTITADGVVKIGNGALNINVPQTSYASGWTVNSGDLVFNDLEAAGQSVAGNAITLNATQTTGGGLQQQSLTGTRVIFNRDYGTPELVTFTGGPVTVVNEGTIRIAATNDRNLQIPDVTVDSTGTGSSVALTLDVPNNRFRGIIPSLTLQDNATIRVTDTGNTVDTGRITAAVVNSLVGANKSLSKIGNRTLELSGDNSSTFTGGTIVVSQGALRVRNNGSLGNAASTTTIERNAALEIGVSNFVPTATLTQQAGSIERWNVEDARGSGNYSVPTGVNLQLNTNLVSSTPRTITMNGGSLEGYLYSDNVVAADQRTIGSAVTLNLASNSSVGQNVLQGVTYDLGRTPTVAQPFGDNITGSYLRIEGNITGSGNLTKTGLDTVIIASTGNTYGDTLVDMGVLRIGANDALPTGKVLTPRLGGMFDLYGYNQTVAGLGTATGGPNPGGVSVGDSGRIFNSGVVDNTLTVNAATDYTYNGTLEMNVALTKSAAGVLTIGNEANTYRGATTVSGGTLSINNIGNGGIASSIGQSSSAASSLILSGGGTLRHTGTANGTTDRNLTLGNAGGALESNGSAPLVFSSTAAIAHTGASARTLEFKGTSTAASFAGVIGDGTAATSVTKSGAGKWTLSGVSTYTGPTQVSAGTLALTSAANLTGSTQITVNSGAFFDVSAKTNFDLTSKALTVNGTVTGNLASTTSSLINGTGTITGSATFNASTISPGNSPGILNFGSGLTTTNGIVNFGMEGMLAGNGAGKADQLNVTGAVDLSGSTAVFTFESGYTGWDPATSPDSFAFFLIKTTGGFTSAFSNVPEGGTVTVGGYNYTATYTANAEAGTRGGGNDFALIPEPSELMLALFAGMGLMARRRR